MPNHADEDQGGHRGELGQGEPDGGDEHPAAMVKPVVGACRPDRYDEEREHFGADDLQLRPWLAHGRHALLYPAHLSFELPISPDGENGPPRPW
jgi:hypothetical protein